MRDETERQASEENEAVKRTRKPSFHLKSYPWYVSDWRMSETRLRLTPLGRYIYRELIDQCYIDGSIPGEARILAKLVDVPLRDFMREWPEVSLSFQQDTNGRLHNRKADEIIPELERWHDQKRIAGKAGGKARAEANAKRTPDERQAFAKPSTSTSTSTSTSASVESACDGLFAEVFNAYPEHRRDDSYLTQTAWAAIMGPLHPEDRPGLHAKILDGLERAKVSEDWTRGDGQYVPNLRKFLEERQWTRTWRGPAKSAFQILAEKSAALIRQQEAEEAAGR